MPAMSCVHGGEITIWRTDRWRRRKDTAGGPPGSRSRASGGMAGPHADGRAVTGPDGDLPIRISRFCLLVQAIVIRIIRENDRFELFTRREFEMAAGSMRDQVSTGF